MKVGLTGHSSGIGKAFTELLDHKGIEWIGFSRSNGHEIGTQEGQRAIVEGIKDCDVFFNNAYDWDGYGSCQIDLLYKVWKEWRTRRTKIVCMSAIGGDVPKLKDEIPPWEEGKGFLGYDTFKAGLDYACKQLNMLPYWKLGYQCKIINIRPGLVDTPLVSDEALKDLDYEEWEGAHKMNPKYIAEVVLWTLQQPEHITSITIA
jgi:NAD(P)-dependent dehydrogenase (short-subunit alcohol dehydrogenase family)